MKSVDRKEFTKYIKKYDLNKSKPREVSSSGLFKGLLESQKRYYASNRTTADNSCKKTKNLLSKL